MCCIWVGDEEKRNKSEGWFELEVGRRILTSVRGQGVVGDGGVEQPLPLSNRRLLERNAGKARFSSCSSYSRELIYYGSPLGAAGDGGDSGQRCDRSGSDDARRSDGGGDVDGGRDAGSVSY